MLERFRLHRSFGSFPVFVVAAETEQNEIELGCVIHFPFPRRTGVPAEPPFSADGRMNALSVWMKLSMAFPQVAQKSSPCSPIRLHSASGQVGCLAASLVLTGEPPHARCNLTQLSPSEYKILSFFSVEYDSSMTDVKVDIDRSQTGPRS
ncbi:hypothetical protein LshimejAT787_0605700 [Lyophyllum shimeji]|uniref:Uncharacterized protein n=1 Tax=Lyophyllum shimeji TaxID=47721 RepID=A0A9P3PPW6_LYOSH|nr:hypothetical protein LshimejAT787_0605700 [Lyophyllum shimeji]